MLSLLTLALVLGLTTATGSLAAECDGDLKATDGYKELSEKLKCFAREIALLKQQKAAAPPATEPVAAAVGTAAPRAVSAEQMQESDKLRFQVVGCARQGSRPVCKIQITPLGTDARVSMYSSTQFFDNTGAQSKIIKMKVNSRDYDMAPGNIPTHNFIADISVLHEFVGEPLAPEATQVAALRIVFQRQGSSEKAVTLRGIDLK